MNIKQLRQIHAVKRDSLADQNRTEFGESEYQFHCEAIECLDRIINNMIEAHRILAKEIDK